MGKSCYSCSMPLDEKTHGNYCQYCTDEKGNLKPREEVKAGLAEWLKDWAPSGTQADFEKRAEHFMQSMPAWAKE